MARTIRNLLWLYLFYHWYLYFPEYLSPGPVLLFWAGAIGLGYGFGCRYRFKFRFRLGSWFRSRLGFGFRSGLGFGSKFGDSRPHILLLLFLTGLAPVLLYYIVKGFFLVAAIGFEDITWDLGLLALDRYFFLMILPIELLCLSTVLVYRSPVALSLEPAFHGLLLAALFFPEGGFQGHLYTHPLSLGISVSLFLLGELLLLILASEEAESSGTHEISGATGGSSRDSFRNFSRKFSRPPFLSSLSLRIRQGLPYAVLLILVLYMAYDRYTATSLEARGGLLKAEMFRFDFTHYLSLEPEIRQTKDLVLLYRRSEPIDRYLLKRYLLSGYDPGKGFFKDPASPDSSPMEIVPPQPRSFPLQERKGRKPIQQDLYILNLDPQALVSLDYPVKIVPYSNWPRSSFSRVYRVEAMALTILPLELSEVESPGMDAKTLAYYTEYGKNPRIKALAEEITRGIDTYYDKVQAIADYLRYDYFYSLKPGKAPDGDQLSHFLFSSKKGYCSYFAFSMALLCRSLGIPARVVIGFYIDPENELLGYYPVRSDMAHAWVEVYFDGFGWVDFDPTSRTPAPGEAILPGGQWKREDIAPLLKEILSHPLEAESLPSGKLETGKDESPLNWNTLYRTLSRIFNIILLPCGIGGILLFRFRYRFKALLCRSPREKVFWAFWAFLQDLAPLGFILPPSLSMEEALKAFGNQIPRSIASLFWELFSLYQQAMFGPTFDRDRADRFLTLIPQVRRELYGQNYGMVLIFLRFHPRSFRRPIR